MYKLVRDQPVAPESQMGSLVVQRAFGERGDTRVFHAAGDEVHHHYLSVPLVRVRNADLVLKKPHHVRRLSKTQVGVLLELRQDVVEQRNIAG